MNIKFLLVKHISGETIPYTVQFPNHNGVSYDLKYGSTHNFNMIQFNNLTEKPKRPTKLSVMHPILGKLEFELEKEPYAEYRKWGGYNSLNLDLPSVVHIGVSEDSIKSQARWGIYRNSAYDIGKLYHELGQRFRFSYSPALPIPVDYSGSIFVERLPFDFKVHFDTGLTVDGISDIVCMDDDEFSAKYPGEHRIYVGEDSNWIEVRLMVIIRGTELNPGGALYREFVGCRLYEINGKLVLRLSSVAYATLVGWLSGFSTQEICFEIE